MWDAVYCSQRTLHPVEWERDSQRTVAYASQPTHRAEELEVQRKHRSFGRPQGWANDSICHSSSLRRRFMSVTVPVDNWK